MADVANEIDAIFKRDADFYRVISKGMRPIVFDLDEPSDTRDETRKQSDAALLNAIKRG
jgi:hypothetical protein